MAYSPVSAGGGRAVPRGGVQGELQGQGSSLAVHAASAGVYTTKKYVKYTCIVLHLMHARYPFLTQARPCTFA